MDEQKLIRQGGVPIGYFEKEAAVLDSAFWGCDVGRELTRNGRRVVWKSGVAQDLEREEVGQPKLRRVRVYQLGAWVEPDKKFIGYDELYRRFGGLDASDYQVVFDGRLDTDDPDALYERLNAAHLPKGYRGHRLTVSDVLELYDETGSQFWYLDVEGFEPVDMTKEE